MYINLTPLIYKIVQRIEYQDLFVFFKRLKSNQIFPGELICCVNKPNT